METSVKLYSLPFGNVMTYLFVLLFVAGNIALPQLCHLVPAGGPTLLPIYFFTLIAAYKYGFKVGLLTALLSPVINHLLDRLEQEMAQHRKGDEHIAESKKRSPRVDADEAFKSRHRSSLLSSTSLPNQNTKRRSREITRE